MQELCKVVADRCGDFMLIRGWDKKDMLKLTTKTQFLSVIVLCSTLVFTGKLSAEEGASIEGKDVVAKCTMKQAGQDQRSRLAVILQNPQLGVERRSLYRRYWKSYDGKDGVVDKMLLFTEFPPDAVGAAFMRVVYDEASGKKVDQWIYLPLLKKIRRVTIRNPKDSFLNSDLAYADVERRSLDLDEHKFDGVQEIQGIEFYKVVSTPREKDPMYGRREQWFLKGKSWDDCISSRIDYFSVDGGVLEKSQFLKWQVVDGAWVWDRVLVRNALTGSVSIFVVSDVEVNIGLDDSLFTARTLRTGPKGKNAK